MAETGSTEPVFQAAWPHWQAPNLDGLVVAITPEAVTGWDLLLARDREGFLVWAGAGADREAHAIEVLARPGVRAAALVNANVHPRRAGLALDVARQLAAERGQPALTGTNAPAVPCGAARVPHLVAVRPMVSWRGEVTDTVVWELMSDAVAYQRFGVLRSDQDFLEAHLERLLRLRGEARRGELPPTAAGGRLAAALAGGGLSIEFAYRRSALLRTLLSAPDMD